MEKPEKLMDTERIEKPRREELRRLHAARYNAVSFDQWAAAVERLADAVPALLAELDDTRAQLGKHRDAMVMWMHRADAAEAALAHKEREVNRLVDVVSQRDATIARVRDFCNASVLQQSQDSGCFVADEDVTVTVAEIEALLPAGAALGGEPE